MGRRSSLEPVDEGVEDGEADLATLLGMELASGDRARREGGAATAGSKPATRGKPEKPATAAARRGKAAKAEPDEAAPVRRRKSA